MKTKIVIVMRADLGLSKGMLVAAGSRASRECYKEALYKYSLEKVLSSWVRDKYQEVCVRVDSLSELQIIRDRAIQKDLLCRSVDTEEGEPVCVAIGPGLTSNIDEVTGNLRLL